MPKLIKVFIGYKTILLALLWCWLINLTKQCHLISGVFNKASARECSFCRYLLLFGKCKAGNQCLSACRALALLNTPLIYLLSVAFASRWTFNLCLPYYVYTFLLSIISFLLMLDTSPESINLFSCSIHLSMQINAAYKWLAF